MVTTEYTVLALYISKSDLITFVTKYKEQNNLLDALDCSQSDIIVIATDLSATDLAGELKFPIAKSGFSNQENRVTFK